MKKFNKNKILNRILYLIFMLLIILSSVYIAKSFISKKEAENERDLLNSIDIEDVKEIEEKYKNSKTNNNTSTYYCCFGSNINPYIWSSRSINCFLHFKFI